MRALRRTCVQSSLGRDMAGVPVRKSTRRQPVLATSRSMKNCVRLVALLSLEKPSIFQAPLGMKPTSADLAQAPACRRSGYPTVPSMI